jgi:hypothetical protein
MSQVANTRNRFVITFDILAQDSGTVRMIEDGILSQVKDS